MSQKHVARVHDAFALGRRDEHSSAGVDRQEASTHFLVPRQQDANRLAEARRRLKPFFANGREAVAPRPEIQRGDKGVGERSEQLLGCRRAGARFAQCAGGVRQSPRRADAINPNADDDDALMGGAWVARRDRDAFEENPGELAAIQQKVVRPFQREAFSQPGDSPNRVD